MNLPKLFQHIHLNDYGSTALILIFFTLLLAISNVFSRLDNVIYDLGQRLQVNPIPQDVVIVAIDEASLSELGRWPWSRATHAELIRQLKADGAAVIGLDIVLSEPDKNNEDTADQSLSNAIRSAGNVVLPVLIETTRTNGQLIETLPLPQFAAHAADFGRVHAVLDEDGIARSVYLYEGIGAPVWQHFSQAVINVFLRQPSKNHAAGFDETRMLSLVQNERKRISFLPPGEHFDTISYSQVLRQEFPRGLFANKIVLVGATASGMNDLLSTPVSSSGQPMPGVEVHANVLESIRHHSFIEDVSPWMGMIVLLVLASLPLLWIPKLPAFSGLISCLLFFAMVSTIMAVLPKMAGIWIPPSAALFSILIAYPVWSWRKLEAARRYLDQELDFLQQSLAGSPSQALKQKSYDNFDARIEQVRAASEQLRFLQEHRKETLSFISHDIRAPLARALLMLDDEHRKTDSSRLYQAISQAFGLAEEFLQISRAEMIDHATFKELDFAGLVHQAIDDAYELATKKEIVLQRNVYDGVIWLNGSFGLLHRAVLNLILNAIKFAPAGSQVEVTLVVMSNQAVLIVGNPGQGIAKSDQPHLFKRFSRAENPGQSIVKDGAGLGLYFVHAVASQHFGSIEVESDVGQMTYFRLALPILHLHPHSN